MQKQIFLYWFFAIFWPIKKTIKKKTDFFKSVQAGPILSLSQRFTLTEIELDARTSAPRPDATPTHLHGRFYFVFRPKRYTGQLFRTFRESFSKFSPSRKFFRWPNNFANFSWRRCDSFGPRIVEIGAILAIFQPFEDFGFGNFRGP